MTGEEIVDLRTSADMSSNAFADFCGVDLRTVYRWEERGRKPVPLTETTRRVLATFATVKPADRKKLAVVARDDGWKVAWKQLFGRS